MADSIVTKAPVAKVERLIDENGSRLELGKDRSLHVASTIEESVGGTGPTAWWRVGLVALGIVAAILLALQLMMGGANTDVVPGTPTTAPEQTQPQ